MKWDVYIIWVFNIYGDLSQWLIEEIYLFEIKCRNAAKLKKEQKISENLKLLAYTDQVHTQTNSCVPTYTQV